MQRAFQLFSRNAQIIATIIINIRELKNPLIQKWHFKDSDREETITRKIKKINYRTNKEKNRKIKKIIEIRTIILQTQCPVNFIIFKKLKMLTATWHE